MVGWLWSCSSCWASSAAVWGWDCEDSHLCCAPWDGCGNALRPFCCCFSNEPFEFGRVVENVLPAVVASGAYALFCAQQVEHRLRPVEERLVRMTDCRRLLYLWTVNSVRLKSCSNICKEKKGAETTLWSGNVQWRAASISLLRLRWTLEISLSAFPDSARRCDDVWNFLGGAASSGKEYRRVRACREVELEQPPPPTHGAKLLISVLQHNQPTVRSRRDR